MDNQLAEIDVINLRDFSHGNYRQIDDEPYGGGGGMVMMADPFFKAIDYIVEKWGTADSIRIVHPTPQGIKWNQKSAQEFSHVEHSIFLCGHYKGIDERVIDKYVTHEYSLGDFVISGGEIASMVMLDSIVRLIPGVLNTLESAKSDSFMNGLLDAPYYTRPREIDGFSVPEILMNGNHKDIDSWRHEKRKERTLKKRKDLWEQYVTHDKNGEDNE